jgi:hypothetical protein
MIALNVSIVHVQNASNFWAQAAMGIHQREKTTFQNHATLTPIF